MHKIDLHTHSKLSPDGALTEKQYRFALESGLLDYVAVTDHNRIDYAVKLKDALGKKIIIGEEIMTDNGEIIGLFLKKAIKPGLTPKETAAQIKKQGGLVYIPHPFETVRKGMPKKALDEIASYVDIIETFNGRAFFQNKSKAATTWALDHNKPGAASSDAHGIKGIGLTYSTVAKPPTVKNLPKLLEKAHIARRRPRMRAVLDPKYNRFRKKLRRRYE